MNFYNVHEFNLFQWYIDSFTQTCIIFSTQKKGVNSLLYYCYRSLKMASEILHKKEGRALLFQIKFERGV